MADVTVMVGFAPQIGDGAPAGAPGDAFYVAIGWDGTTDTPHKDPTAQVGRSLASLGTYINDLGVRVVRREPLDAAEMRIVGGLVDAVIAAYAEKVAADG